MVSRIDSGISNTCYLEQLQSLVVIASQNLKPFPYRRRSTQTLEPQADPEASKCLNCNLAHLHQIIAGTKLFQTITLTTPLLKSHHSEVSTPITSINTNPLLWQTLIPIKAYIRLNYASTNVLTVSHQSHPPSQNHCMQCSPQHNSNITPTPPSPPTQPHSQFSHPSSTFPSPNS